MKPKTRTMILEAWDTAEEEFPEKSTAFLFAIVSDRTKMDHSTIVAALYWQANQKKDST